MGYRHNPDWGWESTAATGFAGLLIVAAKMVIAIAITILVILLTELGRIFMKRGFKQSTTARVLWIALAANIGLTLLTGFLMTNPATFPIGLYLSSWGFLGFTLVVIGCELYEQRQDRARIQEADNLDAYLGEFTPSTPSQNGHKTLTEVGA